MSQLDRKEYEALLEPMQVELANAARWLQHSGRRLVVLFEGRDTAGKGGAINAIHEHINPRQCRVVALPKPTEREAMLKATHSEHAPWTLVDFNDQKLGRLTLLRDLLDQLPETRVDAPAIALPPLPGRLAKERHGVLKPIAGFPP